MTVKNYGCSTTGFIHELECEECKSTDIIQTEQGYVCSLCGLVLNAQRMEYHHPYEQTRVQYSAIHNTTLGTHAERNCNKRSRDLNRLSKIHNTQTKPENTTINVKARREIRRILSALDLPNSFEASIFKKFKTLYSRIEKQSKFRAPRKLVPVIIFHYCRKRNIPLNSKKFLSVSKLSQTDFREGRYVYLEFYPEYFTRDRVALIKNYISEIKEEFELGNTFFKNSLHIADYFWKYLINTTDAVIAGLVSSIAVLCDYNNYRDKVSINEICKTVNIRASTVNARIANTIVRCLKIKEFESPVKSHKLINLYVHKFEILPNENEKLDTVSDKQAESWNELREPLMKMLTKIKMTLASNQNQGVYIEITKKDIKKPELHIFQFPTTKNRQIKVFAFELTPKSGDNKNTNHFGYGAQKGPPWKFYPLINAG